MSLVRVALQQFTSCPCSLFLNWNSTMMNVSMALRVSLLTVLHGSTEGMPQAGSQVLLEKQSTVSHIYALYQNIEQNHLQIREQGQILTMFRLVVNSYSVVPEEQQVNMVWIHAYKQDMAPLGVGKHPVDYPRLQFIDTLKYLSKILVIAVNKQEMQSCDQVTWCRKTAKCRKIKLKIVMSDERASCQKSKNCWNFSQLLISLGLTCLHQI